MEIDSLTKMAVDVSVSPESHKIGLVMPIQTHSATVREICSGLESVEDCDALVTERQGLLLGVHTRDCAPVCFSDGKKFAVAHVGWRGLCGGIIEAVMMHFDSQKTEVFIGPHLHTFEIQKDFCHEAITEKFGDSFLTPVRDRYMFQFKDAIASCVPKTALFDSRNTAEDISLPSYRHKRLFGHIITSVRFTTV